MRAVAGAGMKTKKYIGEVFKSKIVGLVVRMDIVNEGDSGIKGESMQQEEFGGQDGNSNHYFLYYCRLVCIFLELYINGII